MNKTNTEIDKHIITIMRNTLESASLLTGLTRTEARSKPRKYRHAQTMIEYMDECVETSVENRAMTLELRNYLVNNFYSQYLEKRRKDIMRVFIENHNTNILDNATSSNINAMEIEGSYQLISDIVMEYEYNDKKIWQYAYRHLANKTMDDILIGAKKWKQSIWVKYGRIQSLLFCVFLIHILIDYHITMYLKSHLNDIFKNLSIMTDIMQIYNMGGENSSLLSVLLIIKGIESIIATILIIVIGIFVYKSVLTFHNRYSMIKFLKYKFCDFENNETNVSSFHYAKIYACMYLYIFESFNVPYVGTLQSKLYPQNVTILGYFNNDAEIWNRNQRNNDSINLNTTLKIDLIYYLFLHLNWVGLIWISSYLHYIGKDYKQTLISILFILFEFWNVYFLVFKIYLRYLRLHFGRNNRNNDNNNNDNNNNNNNENSDIVVTNDNNNNNSNSYSNSILSTISELLYLYRQHRNRMRNVGTIANRKQCRIIVLFLMYLSFHVFYFLLLCNISLTWIINSNLKTFLNLTLVINIGTLLFVGWIIHAMYGEYVLRHTHAKTYNVSQMSKEHPELTFGTYVEYSYYCAQFLAHVLIWILIVTIHCIWIEIIYLQLFSLWLIYTGIRLYWIFLLHPKAKCWNTGLFRLFRASFCAILYPLWWNSSCVQHMTVTISKFADYV